MTVKFVFKTGEQVKFDVTLKDKFDTNLKNEVDRVIKSTLKAINITNTR